MARESTGSITVHHCWWMLLTLLNIRGRCTEPRKKNLVHHLWRLWREVETLSVRGSIGLFVIPFRFTYTMQMSCISWLVLLRMRSCSRLILIHILEFSSTHIQIGRSLTGNAPSWPKTVRYPRHNLDTAAQNEKHYAVCHPAECLPGFAVAVSMYQALWVRNTWTSPSWDD